MFMKQSSRTTLVHSSLVVLNRSRKAERAMPKPCYTHSANSFHKLIARLPFLSSPTELKEVPKNRCRSRVPVLNEAELEEQVVKGSGPGGQSVNKSVNCVILCHVPTHTVVRCHESRLLHENRKLARKMLIEKLDDLWNGEMSLRRQKEALRKQQKAKLEAKARKQREKRKLEKAELEAAKLNSPPEEDATADARCEQADYEEYGHNPWEQKGDFRR
ncbi:putative peptide chain release factor C12orf65 -like protein [Tropilaelaps mercedesae]|uniref:Putative peptide chain release factor C12orf65-like protein n=1 Tax=Tropilaelaps mercedesae TaxID=418985 RepID=A0A1V9XIR8_9ACAR|nr:putative peptide chain release factor C12orf65 -like protein [Tropilaelaps mercedesae]